MFSIASDLAAFLLWNHRASITSGYITKRYRAARTARPLFLSSDVAFAAPLIKAVISIL
ncbi:hypothetical protein JI435_417830 [Parastagonospora nodorum SN15]|uniref:Uncharacterized protein n=1 Tax=Phaeosphaeria nodorum (strain SN15 / ATCC MYA-4574 / FGSC 10173) TaxID=321614 RepID=A0A7U2FBR3_PHANO|nr:hypothetical protein JI435_417830 [Parastagonospora nodorum SN15]